MQQRIQNLLTPQRLLSVPSEKSINKTYICKNKTNIYINKTIICTNITFIYSFQRSVGILPPQQRQLSSEERLNN